MQHAEIDDTDISTDDENGTFPETTMATTEMASNEYVLNFAFLSFVGFLSIQAVFAMIANSQAMLADCQAMAVDALTYLFNLWAERAKSIPLVGKKGREMTRNERNYHQELQRLYLELIPPAISCCTLIGITIDTLRDAFATLMGEVAEEEEDVSVVIMMIFSLSNLFLDIVNVTCFARSSSSSGLDWARPDKSVSCASCTTMANEKTPLVVLVVNSGEAEETPVALAERTFMAGILSKIPLHKFHDHSDLVNLNMCSAWTHVCADTLRSTAVLIAAAASFLFPSRLSGSTCDAVAAVAVSCIILGSLLPLIHCLVRTARQVLHLRANPPSSTKILTLNV